MKTKGIVAFPLDYITTPRDGAVVYLDYYWLVQNGQAFKAKRSGSLQCNKKRELVELVYSEHLASGEGFDILHIPVAYVVKGQSYEY